MITYYVVDAEMHDNIEEAYEHLRSSEDRQITILDAMSWEDGVLQFLKLTRDRHYLT